jgi:single-strand DNA-binding protein
VSDIITLTGVVATIPRALTTHEGLAITSFRLASSQRRFDRAQEKWVDGETNWYTVTTFRQLATNAAVSVKKGERIVVTGRLRIRDWKDGDRAGTNIEVDADALGHDLAWGTAAFSRNTVSVGIDSPSDSARQPAASPAADFPTEKELAETEAETVDRAHAFATADATTPF